MIGVGGLFLWGGCGNAPVSPTITPAPLLSTPSPASNLPLSPSPLPPSSPTPLPTTTPTPPLHRVFLDAGHGGKDPGAIHRGSDGKVALQEKDVNLDVARRVGNALSEQGFSVDYARESDTLLTPFNGPDDRENRRIEIQARVDKANRAGAELYVSIHFNGHDDRQVAGTEVYYCADRPFADQSRRLAQLLLERLLTELNGIGYPARNRGIHDDYGIRPPDHHLFTLGPELERPSQMPGVLGEALFVTNDAEAAILQQDRGRAAIARAYTQAILAYFQPSPTPGATFQIPGSTPTTQTTPTPGATFPVPRSTPTTPTIPTELVRGNPAWSQIALTFDAGAGSEATPAILDTLQAAGVRATIFLTGQWIRQNPGLTRRIVTDGHQVANHTFDHPNLATLPDAKIQEQLTTTAQLFQETTGTMMLPLFRPPFGARDRRVWQAAAQAGYRSVYWTLDSGDWREGATAAGVRDRVVQNAQNGAIVVMHLGLPQTAEALPEIVRRLQAAGYRLVTITEIEK